MTQSIIFRNPGIIDIEAVTTLGVSVKEGDNPIGRFGAGLKFAISTLLRLGCSVTVHAGLRAHTFGTETTTIRGQEFQLVTHNGQRLGFTTQLGRDWQAWMAFRELASNCRDEDGEYWLMRPALPGEGDPDVVRYERAALEDHTTIVVTGQPIIDVWPERNTILLSREEIDASVCCGETYVLPGTSQYIYYRGVRIYKPARPTWLTYNIVGHLDLTEDRTAKDWYYVEAYIERALGMLQDPVLIREVLTAGENYAEHKMDVPRYGAPGPVFKEAVRELALGSETVVNLPESVKAAANLWATKEAASHPPVALSDTQFQMLDRAKRMLTEGGFTLDEFPLVIVNSLGTGVCGTATGGTVYLSLLPFEKGTREVAATLLEEYAHLKSGANDFTRQFQNWLIDYLLALVEVNRGEPF